MSSIHKGTLDDGRPVEVDYSVTSWGSGPSWDHPGDPVEIEIDAFDCEGPVSDEERERLEQEILEILEREGPPPLDDDVL